ncbi:serine threonine kinase [Pyrenophora seminiperda CCB06]|uniref:Serine threonine kinase n=1 Tax=Pyrenophora seminiperda CCB06 TaxID=1302712 RepID=A0A3M7MD54_9PLEO|nr:serine threonine kinase [Pyrenophora seminiperda CCB06]
MVLQLGQVLRDARWNYQILECLGKGSSTSTIFKAKILPRAQIAPGQWVAIKTASEQKTFDFLKQEHKYYQNPAIQSSSYLRTLYEGIDIHESLTPESSYCLAFEWMDCTLEGLPSEKYGQSCILHKNISKAVLSAIDVLNSQHLIHTVRPEDLSGITLQPQPMRAPEVWSGKGCFYSSDVWSFAVMLFDWIKPCVFGATYMPPHHWTGPWAMAKLLRLFPNSVTPHPTSHQYQAFLDIAEAIEASGRYGNTDEKCFETMSFEEELGKLSIPPSLAAFLRYLFVVDHTQRPTAAQALRSSEFQHLA